MFEEHKYSFEYQVKALTTAWFTYEEWSPIVRIEGCEWQVGAVSDKDNINLRLKCLSTERTSGRVPVSFKLSILKQDGSEALSKDFFVVFGHNFVQFTTDSSGHSIKKMELQLPDSEYARNSCFTIKVGLSPHTATFRDPLLGACSLPAVNRVKPDLKIIIGGHQIQAHRFVLAHQSEYFYRRVFPVTDEPLRLNDCDYSATCTAIRFMYTRECIVNSDNLREVLAMALKFDLNELLLSCLDLLSLASAAVFALFICPVSELPEMRFPVAKGYVMGKNIPTSLRFHSDFWRYIGNNITGIVRSNITRSLTVEEIAWFSNVPEVKAKANPKDLENLSLSAQVAELVHPRPSPSLIATLFELSKLCVICQEKIPEGVIEPCGHLCLCRECTDKFKTDNSKMCPVCKEEFTAISRVCFP